MSKKADKTSSTPDQLFIIGLDEKGKPRGARFPQVDDRVVSAALDLNLAAVLKASPAFAEVAKKLPAGRLYASGKAFIPDIKQAFLDELMSILRQPGDTSEAYRLERPKADAELRCKSPITSGLPRSWDEVDAGHLVLAHAGYEDGWWEAICVKREGDILTLRYRDAPKVPAFQRHASTIALINPGPLPDTAT
jgi:hypothetical protein